MLIGHGRGRDLEEAKTATDIDEMRYIIFIHIHGDRCDDIDLYDSI